ncbi:MAG: FkbM family methyltransferase [Chitinophagaceae bacterium]|nr:FkbM family methyltransferase [Chitinophagaceae bacterium]
MSNNFAKNISTGIARRVEKTFSNTYKKAGLSWPKEIIVKHLPQYGYQTIRLLGKPFSFYERDGFLHSLKEIFVEDIYLQQLPRGARIIDCGSNIGLSVIYLKKLCPDAHIIAFEPDERNFKLLEKNVHSFNLTNTELRKEAIWTENTYLDFSNKGTLGSKIVGENGNDKNTIKVKTTRLKDLLTRKIDFLKLDIEGAEYAVLKDIADNIHFAEKIFIEYHGTYSQNSELNEIFELIISKGFHYYIKEAYNNPTPFTSVPSPDGFDIQLNIFCVKT